MTLKVHFPSDLAHTKFYNKLYIMLPSKLCTSLAFTYFNKTQIYSNYASFYAHGNLLLVHNSMRVMCISL